MPIPTRTLSLSMYVVGNTAEEALDGLLFDTLNEAEEYALDEGLERTFGLDVTVEITVADLTEV